MGKAENRVESYLCSEVKRHGGHQRKVKYIGRNGCLDRLIWFTFPDVAFVEVKSEDGDLEASQAREIPRLEASGWPVYVVSTRAEVDAMIARVKDGGFTTGWFLSDPPLLYGSKGQ